MINSKKAPVKKRKRTVGPLLEEVRSMLLKRPGKVHAVRVRYFRKYFIFLGMMLDVWKKGGTRENKFKICYIIISLLTLAGFIIF